MLKHFQMFAINRLFLWDSSYSNLNKTAFSVVMSCWPTVYYEKLDFLHRFSSFFAGKKS